ncbi:MAG: DNA-binding response regulator, partial [Candidatus Methylomirabilota bacterium]
DGLDLLGILKKQDADMVILDISMPNLRGIEAAVEIKKSRPKMKILILTMHKDSEYLRGAMAAGVNGYLLKENADSELFAAITRIRQGKTFVSPSLAEEFIEGWSRNCDNAGEPFRKEQLTNREKQVLKLIGEGHTSREIADLLCISIRTVERHRANIMEELNLRNTADLVKYAIRKGYL